MKEKVESIRALLNTDIKEVKTTQDIVEIKSKYIGKTGLISELTKGMAELSIEEKKEFGMIINELKNEANSLIFGKEEEINSALLNEKLNKEAIDISLPATQIPEGAPNILEKVIEEVEE